MVTRPDPAPIPAPIAPIIAPIVEVTVAAPVDVVWNALRDPAQIRRWHGWDDPTLDAEIQQIYLSDATVEDAPRRLQLGTTVFDLTDTAAGVRVRITRGARGSDPDWDAYYDDITEGWTSFLQQLKYALERHPGQDRATHFRSGVPTAPGPLADRLGLGEVAGRPVGSAYTATLPIGERVAGTVWFRSDRQLGLTVDEWGDGLLIVGEEVHAAHRPDGGSMAILTTYGLAQEHLERLRTAWDRWWDSEFRAEGESTPVDAG